MRCDLVVVGGELEAYVAALRAAASGARVRLLKPGGGSLHYSGGGIGVHKTVQGESSCFEAIESLGAQHPYRLIGAEKTRYALNWFFDRLSARRMNHIVRESNLPAISAGGTTTPLYAIPFAMATVERIAGRKAVFIDLEGYLDGLPNLCAANLNERNYRVSVVRVDAPARGDSVRIARALDREAAIFFENIRSILPSDTDIAIFPAVLGLDRHIEVVAEAERILGCDVAEIPTMPPSVMGLRLENALRAELSAAGVSVYEDIRSLHSDFTNGACVAITDSNGVSHIASSFIAANGGVLMGGLTVDTAGRVIDSVFRTDVLQTGPLCDPAAEYVQDALNRCGVEVDAELRPRVGGQEVSNVFVTGAQLPHFNPSVESSGEGVAIATAYKAAENALKLCGQ